MKKALSVLFTVLLCAAMFAGCSSNRTTKISANGTPTKVSSLRFVKSDEKCSLCNKQDVKVCLIEIEGHSEMGTFAICENCAKECAYCGEKADYIIISGLGPMGTCSDCYKELQQFRF